MNILNNLELSDAEFLDLRSRNAQTSDYLVMPTGEKFLVLPCIFNLLSYIYEYLRLVRFFEDVSPDSANRMIDLIKFFNSRATQLILGSGAYYLGKLASITAKHLALMLHSLNLLLHELPFLKA